MFFLENSVKQYFVYLFLLLPGGIYAQQDTIRFRVAGEENKKINLPSVSYTNPYVGLKTDSLKGMSIGTFIQPFDFKKYTAPRLVIPANPSEHMKRVILRSILNDKNCFSPLDLKLMENGNRNIENMVKGLKLEKIKPAPGFYLDPVEYFRRRNETKTREKIRKLIEELNKVPLKTP